MGLRIRGPLAGQFVEILSEFCGYELDADDQGNISIGDGLINPFVSDTLRNLVVDMIQQAADVVVTARGDVNGGVIDSFFRIGGNRRVPPRTVFVNDIVTLRRLDPQFCAAMIAHFLAEYSHAAQRNTPRQFADAHNAGLQAEAAVIRDLTGRPMFQGNARAWGRTTALGNGRLRAVRRYGPGNSYTMLLGPGPVFPILSVNRSEMNP